MARMGLLAEVFRLPMVSPSEASCRRIERVLTDLELLPAAAGARMSLRDRVESLVAGKDLTSCKEEGGVRRPAPGLSDGTVRAAEPDASTPTAGASTPGSSRASCSASVPAASSTSRPITGAGRSSTRTRCRCAARGQRQRPRRARRVDDPRRRPCRTRRHLHAADVHQHRRLRRRGHADRLARAGRPCAQIGRHVHISAAAQIGGVIEPVGALPVVIEDEVLVGGNTGVYEGAVVKARAVIAAGTVSPGRRRSTTCPTAASSSRAGPAARGAGRRGGRAGARAVTVGAGKDWGLSLATPVIVKYRDARTDTRTELEQWIR